MVNPEDKKDRVQQLIDVAQQEMIRLQTTLEQMNKQKELMQQQINQTVTDMVRLDGKILGLWEVAEPSDS